MRICVRVLGLELLAIEASTDSDEQTDEPGDCTTTAIGFVRNDAGHEWQLGVER